MSRACCSRARAHRLRRRGGVSATRTCASRRAQAAIDRPVSPQHGTRPSALEIQHAAYPSSSLALSPQVECRQPVNTSSCTIQTEPALLLSTLSSCGGAMAPAENALPVNLNTAPQHHGQRLHTNSRQRTARFLAARSPRSCRAREAQARRASPWKTSADRRETQERQAGHRDSRRRCHSSLRWGIVGGNRELGEHRVPGARRDARALPIMTVGLIAGVEPSVG